MRKRRYLAVSLAICTFSALTIPVQVQAEEVGGGETTIHIRVPDTHSIKIEIGDHGALHINGATYKGIQDIDVERLSYPRFEIIADKGYEIEAVYYEGKNVTGELEQNIYTAPILHEDGHFFKVSFKKGAENIGGSDTSGDGSATGDGSTTGGIDGTDGDHTSGETEENNGSGSQSGSKDETGNSVEDQRKDEIFNELDKIDELLKDEHLSAEKKEELLKQKQELLEELVQIMMKKDSKEEKDIQAALADIEKLLARNDLTKEQRQQLLDKKAELEKELEEMEAAKKQNDGFKIALGILVLVVASGAGFVYYRKKKKEE